MGKRAKLLIVDDEASMREGLEAWLGREHDVSIAADGAAALALLERAQVDVALVDQRMPGIDGIELLREVRRRFPEVDVVIMTAFASVASAVEAMKAGARDYIAKPFPMETLDLVIQRTMGWRALIEENQVLRRQIEGRVEFHGIVTRSPVMRALFSIIERAAATDAPVLVLGENGVGKELVARAVHRAGPHPNEPFVALSCGAYPDTLLEAEMFGHERGAFTGAHAARVGLFEQAGEGTLLLDEVGELSPKAQVDLLRVLQEREFRRVGSNRVIPLRARIVAATHRDLGQRVTEGAFRQDLFYRLRVIRLVVPPLRERREDILPLAEHFLARYSAAYRKPRVRRISPSALRALHRHAWPGNVRELEGVVQQAVTLALGDEVLLEDLPEEVSSDSALVLDPGSSFLDRTSTFQQKMIEESIERAGGHQRRAALELGLSPRAMSYYVKKFGLQVDDD